MSNSLLSSHECKISKWTRTSSLVAKRTNLVKSLCAIITPMPHKFILAFAVLVFGTHLAMAVEQLDTWQTTFKCGGQTLTVASRCKASDEPMTLNNCQLGQTLSNGATQISLPHTSPVNDTPALFAVAWSCISMKGQSYIALSYASGQGQGEEDESTEVFDLDLKEISDYTLQVAVLRQEATGTHGRIHSIFPK